MEITVLYIFHSEMSKKHTPNDVLCGFYKTKVDTKGKKGYSEKLYIGSYVVLSIFKQYFIQAYLRGITMPIKFTN